MDYSALVKKLRDLHRDPRPASAVWLFDNQIALYDAAAAIEALQAELEKKRTADCWGCKCEKVEPKRGDIVRCRECRYRITAHGISDGWVLCSKPYTERGNAMHRADWFCADGEREAQDG